MPAPRPRLRPLVAGVLAILAVRCGAPNPSARAPREENPAAAAAPAAAPALPTEAPPQALTRAADPSASSDQTAPQSTRPPAFAAAAADTAASTAAAAMLIRTGTASVEVDSVELAVAGLRALASRLGGYVANSSLAAGADQVRSATVELKVPAARFDALTAGLIPLGKVEAVDVKAEDVGEEYVDVAAQLENGRRLEARLVALAERQSTRLADLLSVERELARVRGEIDRAEGRLRYLRAHSATSTLSVTVHARAPLVGNSPATNPIAEAFRNAWRVFVAVVAFLITALGVLVPLAIVAALIALARRRWLRARPARYGASVAETTGDQGPAPRPPNTPRSV